MKLFPVDLACCNFQTHPFCDGEPGHVGPAPRPAHDYMWQHDGTVSVQQGTFSNFPSRISNQTNVWVTSSICICWNMLTFVDSNMSNLSKCFSKNMASTDFNITPTSYLIICLRQNEAWNIIKCHNKKSQKAQCLPEPGWSLAAPEAWPPKLGL